MIKFFVCILFMTSPISLLGADDILKILSTTSTRDSGFYDYIIPEFNRMYDIEVYVIAAGSGHAMDNAKKCNGDILITHSPRLEKDFVSSGHGVDRAPFMFNDFVVIGPKNDPAKISKSLNVISAFQKLYKAKAAFISRGDNSGTHLSELNIWSKSGYSPKMHSGEWYLESGQGMGATLNVAVGSNSYTYTDRATWSNFDNKQNHIILYSGDENMINQYSITRISPKKCPNIDIDNSNLLRNWLISNEGQITIREFTINNETMFIPNYD